MSQKYLFCILLLLESIAFTLSYVYLVTPEQAKSKDHEGYCYHKSYDALIKVAESKIFPNCEEVSCGSDYFMSIHGCGAFHIEDPHCKKWERDLTKPYPECCNSLICVEFVHEITPEKGDFNRIEREHGEIEKN